MDSLCSPRRRLAWAAPLIAAAIILSGCGGSSKATAANPTTTVASGSSTTAGGASRSAFTACMTSHGIPASVSQGFGRGRLGGANPTGGGGVPATGAAAAAGGSNGSTPRSFPTPSLPTGVTQQQFQSALQACRVDLPAGGGFGGAFANTAQAAAYRNCLKLNGVTLPSPPGSGTAGSAQSTPPVTIDRTSPTYQAALKACAALRPNRSGASTTTTTTS